MNTLINMHKSFKSIHNNKLLFFFSLPSLTWRSASCRLWIDASLRVPECEARPAMRNPRRAGCGLICRMMSSSTAAASQPAPVSPHTIWIFSPALYWEPGLAVLVTGLRRTTDGPFCSASLCEQVEKGEGDRCVYVPLVAHNHPEQMPSDF